MHVNGFDSSEGVVLPARRARFSSCPFHVAIWDTLRSKTSFCVTGAGHRTLFHPCGRRGTFSALPKRWHAWVKMRGAFGRRFKGRRPRFVKLSSFLILDMMLIPCGSCGTLDASGSFFVAGAVLCDICNVL